MGGAGVPVAYYNENDPKTAAWLRELIRRNLIAPGDVDERSIEDVCPDDVRGYEQCHFFAGIGGWSYALRLAGWPDDRPVWTGSCPCQPFSQAGARGGVDDPRHLWPAFRWLIDQCRPVTIFGEQVASADGRSWLSGVRSDLDLLGYGFGAADLCAAGVGAPHIRQRLFWVADSGLDAEGLRAVCGKTKGGRTSGESARCRGATSWLGDAAEPGLQGGGVENVSGAWRRGERRGASCASAASGHWGQHYISGADGKLRRIEPGLAPLVDGFPKNLANVLSCCRNTWRQVIDYAERAETNANEIVRMVRRSFHEKAGREEQPTGVRGKLHEEAVLLSLLLSSEAACDGAADISSSKKEGAAFIDRAVRCMRGDYRDVRASHRREPEEQPPGEPANAMHELSLILARDVATYRKEAEFAHASLARLTLLRGFGNAIVPQVAAEFIRSCAT